MVITVDGAHVSCGERHMCLHQQALFLGTPQGCERPMAATEEEGAGRACSWGPWENPTPHGMTASMLDPCLVSARTADNWPFPGS